MTQAFAMSIFIGILFCGFTIDLGMIEYTRLLEQRAADAAAIGAQVSHDLDDPNWASNGQADAGLNGFTNGTNSTTVTVFESPNYGNYAGRYDALQATVSKTIQTSFIGIFTAGKQTVTVNSISLMTPCVYLRNAYGWTMYPLKLVSGSSLGNWGGSTLGCPVYVGGGIFTDANSSLWTNATNSTAASTSSSLSGGIFHTPHYNSSTLGDPLLYTSACKTLSSNCVNGTAYGIQAPSFSSCTYTNQTWASGTLSLSPGTYCSSFNFSNNIVNLTPGLYIIAGGGTWSNSTVTGNGVTLYFTQKGDGNYGTFKVTNSTMALSAPTTSSNNSIPGVLMMNDPNWVPTGAQDFSFLSGANNTGDGIYYFVKTGLAISSSTLSATHYMAFDVDNLLITSSALAPKSNFTPLATGNPFTPIGSLVQ
jgi:hypothetical protein